MRKSSLVVSLLALAGLCSCLPPSEVKESSAPLSTAPETSSSTSSFLSSESTPEGPKDELIATGLSNDLEEDAEGNPLIRIAEFNEPLKVSSPTASQHILKYGDTVISDHLYNSFRLVASDINGDGFREIVFFEEGNNRNREFSVYDLKNNKTLLKQTDMTIEEFGHIACYRFYYDMKDGRLTFLPYAGNYSERSTMDYGHLKWSEEKGCYFEWENILGIEKIEFVRFFLNDENMTPVLPSNPGNVYTFETSKQYYMEFKITRNKTDRELDDQPIDVVWGNDNPSHFGEIRSPWNGSIVQNDVAKGQYYYYFTVVNPCEERVWDWYLTNYGFKINDKVVE